MVLRILKNKENETPKNKKTLMRADLVKIISSDVPDRYEARQILEVVLDEIAKCLAKGEPVKGPPSKAFLVRRKKERPGRNSRTGKNAVISARIVTIFRATQTFKRRVGSG